MTSPHTPRTLALIDGLSSGHHTTYMRLVSRAAAEEGWRVEAFLPSEQALGPWVREHAPDVADRVRCHPFSWTAMTPPLWRLWSVYVPLIAWVRAARAVRRARVRPDLVCFCWLDDYIVGAHRFFRAARPWVFPWRWTGLYFQPWHVRLKIGGSEWSATAEEALRARGCGSVGILDRGAAEQIRQRCRAPVFWIPDATDSSLPGREGALSTAIRAAAAGRKVITLAGGLAKRKGLLGFLDLVESCRDQPWLFVVAGSLDDGSKNTYSAPERGRIERIFGCPPSNLMVHHGRIAEEPEFNALIAGSDVVVAVYDPYANTSGILTKAGWFGRPVVVGDGFCMAETVKQYRLGAVVEPGNTEQARVALTRLCAGQDGEGRPFAPDTEGFRRDYGYDAFRAAVGRMLATAGRGRGERGVLSSGFRVLS